MFKKSALISAASPQEPEIEDILHTEGRWFKDAHGRTWTLRGVNLSGSTKLPAKPCVPSHISENFFNHRDISFVGRPFPLEEADTHFSRLRSWGFNFLRFLITWEALEHSGPRQYDEEYVDYVIKVLKKAKEYGFKCFIDPHQDTWSRFTGGSGAPGWTLELAGFDLEKLSETGAAIIHNTYPDPKDYPKMIWPTNYYKLACATMFTLFFGGDTFAPRCVVDIADDGNDKMRLLPINECETWSSSSSCVRIQNYLQSHYINAVCFLISRIKSFAPELLDICVTGYDTLNEPSRGYVGWETLKSISKHQELKLGYCPTALQGFLSGNGIPCEVEFWIFGALGPKKQKTVLLNPKGQTCWREGYGCIWEAHGLYDPKTLQCLKDNYFDIHPLTGRKVDFTADFWRSFVRAYTFKVRDIQQRAIIFVEPPVNEVPPFWRPDEGDPCDRICYAPHWYDGLTLMNKHFSTVFAIDYIGFIRGRYSNILQALSFGFQGIKANFARQILTIRKEGLAYVGDTPFILGEIGIPFDMDNKAAYRNGYYKNQAYALDANISALETNLLNFTLWNYCSDNSNEWGDMWNGEDLSIFSKDSPETECQNHLAKRMMFKLSSITGRQQDLGKSSVNKAGIKSGRNRDLDFGARALSAFMRPYAVKTAGEPLYQTFDMFDARKTFHFAFKPSTEFSKRNMGQATEVFLPRWHYGIPIASALAEDNIMLNSAFIDSLSVKGNAIDKSNTNTLYFDVEIEGGSWSFDETSQILHIYHGKNIRNNNSNNSICEVVVRVITKSDVVKRLDKKVKPKRCFIL